jgi:hypothetical protein
MIDRRDKMNWLKQSLMGAMVLLALTGCNVITHEHEETYTLDTKEMTTFHINHDEGDVNIVGVEGTEQITVTAIFTAWSDESAEHAQTFSEKNLSVSLIEEQGQAFLKTSVKRGSNPEQGFIHLNIEMPNHLLLDYRQNEGQLKIEDLRSNITLQHGTNHLSLKGIQGDIQITDGAGNISIEEVSGEMIINNNAGMTKIINSTGEVRLIAGSGAVELKEHEGDVTVRSGVGNIDIDQVIGDVTILESSDGTVKIENVTGTIKQP